MKVLEKLAHDQGWRVWSVDEVQRLNGASGRFVWWYFVTTDKGQFAAVSGFGAIVLLPISWEGGKDDGDGLPLPLAA